MRSTDTYPEIFFTAIRGGIAGQTVIYAGEDREKAFLTARAFRDFLKVLPTNQKPIGYTTKTSTRAIEGGWLVKVRIKKTLILKEV